MPLPDANLLFSVQGESLGRAYSGAKVTATLRLAKRWPLVHRSRNQRGIGDDGIEADTGTEDRSHGEAVPPQFTEPSSYCGMAVGEIRLQLTISKSSPAITGNVPGGGKYQALVAQELQTPGCPVGDAPQFQVSKSIAVEQVGPYGFPRLSVLPPHVAHTARYMHGYRDDILGVRHVV